MELFEAAYQKIDSSFESGNFAETIQLVNEFRLKFRKSKRESSVTFLTAQSALRTRQLDEARLEAQRLMLKFPDSEYADDARLILAECDVLSEHWEDAREHLGWILGFSQDKRLVDAARSLLLEMDQFLAAEAALSEAKNSSSYYKPKVGLILPLSSPEPEEAQSFLTGFKTRWDAMGLGDIVIFDSENDPIKTVRLAQMLSREEHVWGIVGGLGSSEAAVLAAVAEADKVPFLTTSCGVSDLAGISRYVFQGRPDYNMIGNELGRYATEKAGLRNFGILAPINQSGRQIARGFKEAIAAAGGEILVEEAYYPGSRDFSMQLKHVRAVGLRLAYEDSLRSYYAEHGSLLIDEKKYKPKREYLLPELFINESVETAAQDTVWVLSPQLIDSLWISDHVRLRKWMTITKKEIDSLEIPLKVYDGFLLVVEHGAVEIMAPQFARFNLVTQIFGDENWVDREALARVSNYVDGMIFSEPLAVRGGEAYYEFAAAISNSDTTGINSHHLEGERAATMALFAITQAEGSESFRNRMSQIRDLETLSGKVSLLKEERIDRRVTLMQFESGSYKIVHE